jgi:4-amino-4-deoxy-L-arabinose transferase-like glycosyltransferase
MAGPRRSLRLAFIAITALILYLPGLGRPALWEPDEGRYAEIAREMYLSRDLVTPRDNFVRYLEKPPLVYWIETAAVAALGTNEFAVRLPAALFSAAEVVVTAAIAEAMAGEAAALLAAIALALSPLFFGFARFATLDPALAFFITAALGAFYAAARSGDFASGTGREWFVATAAMLALGTLTKGPVALVLGGAIALIWILLEGRGGEIARMPWLSAIVVYCIIAAPWFVVVARRNPGFLHFFFVHEHLTRYVVTTEHGWGPWFFIPVVIGGTWPWIFFVPIGTRAMREDSARHSALRFLAVWFIVIFLFFSIPRAKLGSYILPALPALAILAGIGMTRLWSLGAKQARWILGWFAALNLAAVASAAAALLFLMNRLNRPLLADGGLIAALLAAMAILCFVFDRSGNRPGAAVITIILAMVLMMGIGTRAREDSAGMATYRKLAREITPHLGPGCILGSYRHFVQSLPFYTGAREALISYRGELAPFGDSPDAAASFIANDRALRELWGSGNCMVVVVNRKDLPGLETLSPAPVIIGCEGKKLALSNRAEAAAAMDCR